MIHQGDWLLPQDGPPLRGGWLRVESGRIAAVGAGAELPSGAAVHRLEGCVLLPGLINAHCHLELTTLHGRLDHGAAFPSWVQQLRGLTAGLGPADYRHAAREGVRQLLRGGTTTVVDVGNTGEAIPVLAASPLRSFACAEALGLDPAHAADRLAQARALAARALPVPGRFHPGVAPHAAYSCSPELLAALARHQAEHGLPVTLHASESAEEERMFREGSGPLAEYCRGMYPDAPRHHGDSPVRWLERLGLLPDRALVVHGNHLDEADADVLARRRATVVHCPSSHDFFGHGPFPWGLLRGRGIPVCFGTDSLASGDSLSMLEQLRRFRRTFPGVPAREILRMATAVAADALGMGDRIGSLRPGLGADFLAVRTPSPAAAPEEAEESVLEEHAEVALTVIDGASIPDPGP